MMFALLSKHPEYSQIVKPFVALSPVFYLNELKTPMRYLRFIRGFLRRFPNPFLHINALRNAYSTFCSNRYALRACHFIYHSIIGIGWQNIDPNRLGVFMDNLPMGAGGVLSAQLLQITHFAPTYFDYGNEEMNRRAYKSDIVPLYDESQINSTDIALLYAKDDWFNTMGNVHLLKRNLKGMSLVSHNLPHNL